MIAIILLVTNLLLPETQKVEIVDGYTNTLSSFPGDSLALYLNSSDTASRYNLKMYDLSGKVVWANVISVSPQTISNTKPYENGFGYRMTTKVRVPSLASGVYLLDNTIPIIIKTRSASITIVYSSNTVNAYCNAGGKSLYGFNSTDKLPAKKVSFLRPLPLPRFSEAFLRWLPSQNFENVGYVVDSDLEDYEAIKRSKLLIIAGHSEYWSLQARKNFDRFVHEGKNALVLSGNTMWWQVRFTKSKDQLICYRSVTDDPIKSIKLKTLLWNDPSLKYPITNSIGTDFAFAGYGRKNDRGWDGFKIVTKSPLLENTNLKVGDIILCPSDELDGAPLTGFANEMPLLDYAALGFQRAEIVGYDYVQKGIATWIVFKASSSSGIVINTASTDWCSYSGIGSNPHIQQITATMIKKLLNKENVFSNQNDLADAAN
jgi:hypothetical protein